MRKRNKKRNKSSDKLKREMNYNCKRQHSNTKKDNNKLKRKDYSLRKLRIRNYYKIN